MDKWDVPQEKSRYTRAGDERRVEIIRAAYMLIAKKGLGGLRISEVAERVKINNATLLYYFPSKEKLIDAVVVYLSQIFMQTHSPELVLSETATPQERMHQYFLDLEYQISTSPEQFIVMDELFMQSLREPGILSIFNGDPSWVSYLKSIIDDGVAQGAYKAAIDSETVALVIITFCMGLPLLGNFLPEKMIHAIRQFEKSIVVMLS